MASTQTTHNSAAPASTSTTTAAAPQTAAATTTHAPTQGAATSPNQTATESLSQSSKEPPVEHKKHGIGAIVDKIVHPHGHSKTPSQSHTHADTESVPVAVPAAPSDGPAHIAPGGSAVGGILIVSHSPSPLFLRNNTAKIAAASLETRSITRRFEIAANKSSGRMCVENDLPLHALIPCSVDEKTNTTTPYGKIRKKVGRAHRGWSESWDAETPVTSGSGERMNGR
ncbi:hypothetical protein B0H14DRAFT_2622330 [Mycena olivaceomarginata]|nr:hypothetical protein B0H14DRAFT_2622330 [Mycena olivaceomarginata]